MKTENFYLIRLADDTVRSQMDVNRDDDGNSQHESRYQYNTKYQCLLKCESNKTYHQPGNCPDCNMKLISVDESYNRH